MDVLFLLELRKTKTPLKTQMQLKQKLHRTITDLLWP